MIAGSAVTATAPVDARTRRLTVLGVVVAVLVIDQISKQWALGALPGRTVRVVGDILRLRLVFNPGAAFGLGNFSGAGVALGLVAIAAAIWIVWYAARVDKPVMVVGLGLIAGGAIGNVVDRMFRDGGWLTGRVVDFIELPRWPVFNVADACVVAGVCLVILTLFRDRDEDVASEHAGDSERTAA